MKTMSRIVPLAAALGLVAVAVAHSATAPTCIYQCQNTTTGKFITRSESDISEAGCCGGEGLSCPPGTVYYQSIAWNGQFCRSL
jgi:hypothetical protein